jgi:uncharacterized protein YigE (DUF2233 family)
MRNRLVHSLSGLGLAALIAGASAVALGQETASPPVAALSCAPKTVQATDYTICTIDLAIARPKLFWKNAKGAPYRTFNALADAVAADGGTLAFAMNAGMYAEDFSPLGLYVEDGRQLRPVNRHEVKSGPVPNFYKQPNGVFFLDATGAGILPTSDFIERREKVDFATQSGPMLVVSGKLNSIFIEGSRDRKIRSGVGVCEGGALTFAISDDPVNFHDFATLFRDELGCANALFLDGGRGAGLYLPALGRQDWSWHGGYGPIVGLVE